MKYNFTNKTSQIQEVHFCKGTSMKVLPNETVELDSKEIFPYEKERCLKFFKIEEKVEKAKTYKKYSEPEPVKNEEIIGGIE